MMKHQATAFLLIVASSSCLLARVQAQFHLPAQSHLGRLVQSITSPLVISSSASGYREATEAANTQLPFHDTAAYYGPPPSVNEFAPIQPEATRHEQQMGGYLGRPMMHHQHQPMQQVPSHERAIPQQYFEAQNNYGQQREQSQRGHRYHQPAAPMKSNFQPSQYSANNNYNHNHNNNYDGGESQQVDDDSQSGNEHMMNNQRDQVGAAPSNNKHNSEYQMGAYLGPVIDDKEINGAFNSNNDDDDDGASYGPDMGGPRREKAASNASPQDYSEANFGGPTSGGEGEQRAGAGYGPPAYDEESADEDDGPQIQNQERRNQRPRFHGANGGSGGMGGHNAAAASQYRQRGSYGQHQSHSQSQDQGNSGEGVGAQGSTGNMMAAANGNAPYGYANGPIDLTGLMAGNYGAPNAGFQIYQAEGPVGYGPGYGPMGQLQGGRKRQAASSNSNYGFNGQPKGEYEDNDNDED